jgi:membrane-bound lytic murein transglycosylase F
VKLSAINSIFREQRTFQFTVVVLWIVIILYLINPFVNKYKYITLHKILKAGELTVITRNTPHCYYIYRDEPMGFEYELLKAFADYLNVRLNLKLAENWEEMIPALENGSCALIAAGMTITSSRKEQVVFSNGYMQIQQHIISHRNGVKIKNLTDLVGKTIHVRTATSYQERLQELQNQGINFAIELHDDLPTEELIQRVADGEIDLTVADSNVALLNRRHYPAAIMGSPVNDAEYLGWAVHPQANQLMEKINSFFKTIKENGKFGEIYDEYYGEIGDVDFVDLRAFHRRIKTRLSRYSPFIKVAAKKHGFDWRLIAAQIYQESHFNPWAKSPSGARGLMQLLPSTARSLGVGDIYNPVENINAGVRYLKKLYDLFDKAEGNDRLLIAIAAYNIGQGHIYDARNLAIQKNLNPNLWESLEETLPLLRYKKYYKKSKYGYCRGTEPVRYIEQINIYYDILKRQGIELGGVQAKKDALSPTKGL